MDTSKRRDSTRARPRRKLRVGEARNARGRDRVGGKAAGRLHGSEEWGYVYSGPSVKCYTVIFARLDGQDPAFVDVWTDETRVAILRVRESTDVCGKRIRVRGNRLGSHESAYWEAAPIPLLSAQKRPLRTLGSKRSR